VDNATEGDTIEVHSGTYYENVNVTKQLTLQGRNTGGGMPVVLGGRFGSSIEITASGVMLEGFIVKNLGVSQNGINVSSNNNIIRNNIASNNNHGIYLYASINNTLSNNTATNNNGCGIILNAYSNANTLTGNNVSSNGCGIHITYSSGNLLYLNNLTNNTHNAYDNGANQWDNGSVGNHYSDFDEPFEGCFDNNTDGICDSPHIIGSSVDRYPLVSLDFDAPPELVEYTISNRLISPDGDGVDDSTTIDVRFSERVSAQILIENASGVVRHLYQSRSVVNPRPKIWGGEDDDGVIVAAGVYVVNVTMDDGVNPVVFNNTETVLVESESQNPLAANITLRYVVNNAGSPVVLSAENSTGDIVSYLWDFGDNTNGTGVVVSHVYSLEDYQGYLVNLTVRSEIGAVAEASVRLPVWLAGDANGDGRVNIIDAARLGLHWNSEYGAPSYDDGADLNNDDVINIVDAAIIGLNWGSAV
jgi:parallel beta-helix repeat protein